MKWVICLAKTSNSEKCQSSNIKACKWSVYIMNSIAALAYEKFPLI